MKILLILLAVTALNGKAFALDPVKKCTVETEIRISKGKNPTYCECMTTSCRHDSGLIVFDGFIDCNINQEMAEKRYLRNKK